MSHITRDPDTGQFVSQETGHVGRFRDYTFQHVKSQYRVSAGDLPGAFPISEEDIRTTELDDILHRGERAELVALQLHHLYAAVPGTSSAEGNIEAMFELSTGTGSQMVTLEDRDSGSVGDVTTLHWVSDDPDILYFASIYGENSFADTASGIGGGADTGSLGPETVHYPREFGACPDFDERDEISESWRVNVPGAAEPTDSLIEWGADYSLVFAVEERDR